jgi:isopenicillin N synthase-like dioxygenase
LPQLRPSVLAYIEDVTTLGQRLMGLLSLSLQLPEGYITEHVAYDPLAIVRAFRYPPRHHGEEGIGEHTDYGLWTMLATSGPGLMFRHPDHGWVDVSHLDDGIVCNVGDVLDRMTKGRFKSRPHRVRNCTGQDRLSIPFFFDPA